MTSENVERLKEMQKRIEQDAARVTTRDDLIRLRMYWGDLQTVIDAETETE